MASLIHEPERPVKKWRVDYSLHGRRSTRRFPTKREAEAFIGDLAHGRRPAETRLTLAAWVPRWIETHGREWEPRTRRDRARDMDRFILPHLGGVRLRDLSRADIRAWRAHIAGTTATLYQAEQAKKTLSTCLGDAVDDDLLPANPAAGLKALPRRVDRREPATIHEVEAVRAAMTRPRDRAVVSLMAYGGLRPAEVRHLTWADVRQATLVVRRGDRVSGGTKTESVRAVPIIPVIREDLDDLDRDGPRVVNVADWDNWTMRVWRPTRRDVGVTREPYSLRHTAASLWIAEGRTVLEVAQLLGHSSPRLTLSTYGHLFAEAQLAPGESMQDAAGRARAHAAASRRSSASS